MEKNTGGYMERVGRRLSMVKVVVDLLNHELDVAKNERTCNFDKERLAATVNTLELFVEDLDQFLRTPGGSDDSKKVVETPRATVSRLS